MRSYALWIVGYFALVAMVTRVHGNTEDDAFNVKDPDVKTRLRVLGHSGKIIIAPKDGEAIADSKGAVTIEMASLSEKDEEGAEVSDGSDRHVFNTFANQEFAFSVVSRETLQTLDANFFTFTALLENRGATLTVGVYVFRQDGVLTVDGEKQGVNEGAVKWYISIENWDWCSPCMAGNKETYGRYLDFTLSLKSPGPPREIPNGYDDTHNYDIGQGAVMKLSKKVKVGDDWTKMYVGFPKVTQQGSSTELVFRFEKDGNKTFFYDPAIIFNSGTKHVISIPCLLAIIISVFVV